MNLFNFVTFLVFKVKFSTIYIVYEIGSIRLTMKFFIGINLKKVHLQVLFIKYIFPKYLSKFENNNVALKSLNIL